MVGRLMSFLTQKHDSSIKKSTTRTIIIMVMMATMTTLLMTAITVSVMMKCPIISAKADVTTSTKMPQT